MPTILATTEKPVAIVQAMKAGSNFGGVAPQDGGTPLAPTFLIDTYRFAPGTAGGLFDPTSHLYNFEDRDPLCIIGVELLLANQSSWKLEKTDADGVTVILYSGAAEAQVVKGRESPLYTMLWGEVLKLTTVGATQAMTATIKLAPYYLAGN